MRTELSISSSDSFSDTSRPVVCSGNSLNLILSFLPLEVQKIDILSRYLCIMCMCRWNQHTIFFFIDYRRRSSWSGTPLSHNYRITCTALMSSCEREHSYERSKTFTTIVHAQTLKNKQVEKLVVMK